MEWKGGDVVGWVVVGGQGGPRKGCLEWEVSLSVDCWKLEAGLGDDKATITVGHGGTQLVIGTSTGSSFSQGLKTELL